MSQAARNNLIVGHGGKTGRGGFVPAGRDLPPDLAPHVPRDLTVPSAPKPVPPPPQAVPAPPAPAPAEEPKAEAKSEPKAAGGPPKGPPARAPKRVTSQLSLPASAAEARALKLDVAQAIAQTLGVDETGTHEDVVGRLIGELGLE